MDEEVPKPEEAEEGGEQSEVAISDEEDFGIDEDGNLTASLPPEFLELMKDEGPPPNYWLMGFGTCCSSVHLEFFVGRSVKKWLERGLCHTDVCPPTHSFPHA